jgi:1-deoxy-D-xylulose-5-phosphate reductoisomerase
LEFAYHCGKKGGTWPAVMNAANEAAVQLFLSGEIKFVEIAPLVMQTTREFEHLVQPTLSDIIHVDAVVKTALTHT